MTYAVKEAFLTLQGEGVQAGSRAVFLRFAGCNLWSGREADRRKAVCQFCDTDFVGTDGPGGGKFAEATALAGHVAGLWGSPGSRPSDPADGQWQRLVVVTGRAYAPARCPLIDALHQEGFRIAVESNGTIPATPGIDWLCVSPKAGSDVVQRSGDELKLVWPQAGIDPAAIEQWDFAHFLVQPMDCADREGAIAAAIALVMERPRWRLTLQAHKVIGLR